jgi:glycogen synthase
MSAADMILIPSGDCYGIEKTLYTALRNGCIPVTAKNCFSANNLSDIFDDLSTGCMFKNNEITEDKISDYESVFFKALEFYNNNSTCWNSIIKNAMNYNYDWDFGSLEIYNNLYDDLL